MTYLIVMTTNGKHYLVLTEEYSIQAYHTLNEVVDAFDGFTRFYYMGRNEHATRSKEFSGSATIGMLNLMPKAIEVDIEAEDLANFIVDMKPVKVWGGNIGKGYVGVEVKDSILNFPNHEIWGKILERANQQINTTQL